METEVLKGFAEVRLVSLALAQSQRSQDREVHISEQLRVWQDQGRQQGKILLQGFCSDFDDVLCQLHSQDVLRVLHLIDTSAQYRAHQLS